MQVAAVTTAAGFEELELERAWDAPKAAGVVVRLVRIGVELGAAAGRLQSAWEEVIPSEPVPGFDFQ